MAAFLYSWPNSCDAPVFFSARARLASSSSGCHSVTTTASTPFFGAEELHLLETLAHLSGLALERAELYDRERIAARELAEREWQLAEAQRTAHMGSYTWDLGTGAVAWSDEMYRILGFDPAESVRTGSAFSRGFTPRIGTG